MKFKDLQINDIYRFPEQKPDYVWVKLNYAPKANCSLVNPDTLVPYQTNPVSFTMLNTEVILVETGPVIE